MQCMCPDIAKALALTMAIVVALSKPLTVENLEKMNFDGSRYKVSITQVDTFTRRYCKLITSIICKAIDSVLRMKWKHKRHVTKMIGWG